MPSTRIGIMRVLLYCTHCTCVSLCSFFFRRRKRACCWRELPGGPVFKRDLLTDQTTLFRTYMYLHDTGHVYCFIFSIRKLLVFLQSVFIWDHESCNWPAGEWRTFMRDNYIFTTINRSRWVGDVIARFGFFWYFGLTQLNLFDAN